MNGVRSGFKVTVLQERLLHYRVLFFERLKSWLDREGIEFHLVHGQTPASEAMKQDEGHLEWADRVVNRFWPIGGTDILWQPLPRPLRDSDLVVVMQENRIISNYPLLLKRHLGSPKVAYWGHGVNVKSIAPYGLRERWKRLMLDKVDWWFAYTSQTVKHLRVAGFPDERITCLDNAFDTVGFRRELEDISVERLGGLRRELGLIESAQVGIYCGSLYPEKRLDLIVSAADRIHARIPSFHLIVIGEGPNAPELRQAFSSRPWAHVVGVKKGPEKAAYFRLARVVLNPGLVGLHILDAFCAGLPLVTTATAKHSTEIVYVENGVNALIAGDRPEEYAGAVINLLEDANRYACISRAASAASRRYTLENMVGNFAEGIVHCLEISRRPSITVLRK
jgi:L-malate glycosyltransferase